METAIWFLLEASILHDTKGEKMMIMWQLLHHEREYANTFVLVTLLENTPERLVNPKVSHRRLRFIPSVFCSNL